MCLNSIVNLKSELLPTCTYVHNCTFSSIQTPGFDLGFCNFHSHSETLGLSFQLHGATLTTFAPVGDSSCLVESGLVDLGPIIGDLSLREPLDCVPKRQIDFLRLADRRTKRLWFLWEAGHNCGCWGACQFLEGSINRPLTRGKKDSAVYCTQVTTQGVDKLESSLLGQSIRDTECLQLIHRALLQHHQHKYTPPPPPEVLPSRPYSMISDDESFVSAHGSLTSLLLEEEAEFISLDNLNAASLSLQGLSGRPRNKPAALNLDVGQEETDKGEGGLGTYKDVGATHTLTDLRLRVSIDPPQTEREEEERLGHASVKRSRSDGAALRPKSMLTTVPQTQEYLLLRLPQITAANAGQVPMVNPKGVVLRSRERSRVRSHGDKQKGLATFSLCVNVEGQPRVLLTPIATNMISK